MANENVAHFTDANFDEEVIKSKVPVLVDFWAEWCQPCRRLAPTIEKLAGDYANRIKIGKLDTDANHATASKFGISAIPTVLLFKGGQVCENSWVLGPKRNSATPSTPPSDRLIFIA